MRDIIAGFVGEELATGVMLMVVTLAIVLAFLVLFAIFKGFSGTGIRSSRRTRQARLAVMDAAIVDSRRRLVLVRRDDIEHLILIGGPTDVVVEQNIVRSGSSTSAKPANTRGTNAPVAQEAPAAARPVPVAPARMPTSPPSTSPSGERPVPTSSPQIRPATKPPEPQVSQASMSSAPAVVTREPAVAVAPAETLRTVAAVAPSPVQTSPAQSPPAQSMAKPVAPVSTTTPPGAPKKGRHSPILAQASSSTAAIAAAAAAPVATLAAAASVAQSTTQSTTQATTQATPSATLPNEGVSSSPAISSDDIAENQLADFEDNLAMNLGETLVAEDGASADKSALANEMDELLSEITSGGRS